MRLKLSDAWLRSMTPPTEGRLEIRDLGCPGLVLRVTKARKRDGGAGAGSFTASWSARGVLPDGRHGRVTLGTYPQLGLAEARREALVKRAALQTGADPVAEKRAKRAEGAARRSAPTVEARWRQWSAAASRSAMKGRGWSDLHAERVAWMLEKVVNPAIGDRPLAETTRADWTALVADAQGRGSGAAANVLRTIRPFLNHAEAAGWIALPLLPRKSSILAPAAAPRERSLTDDELAAVWKAAGTLSAKARTFARLLILTAARRGEAADIALGEIDRAASLWTLPPARTKNRNGHVMPLCALALAEVDAVWPEDAADLDPSFRLLGRTRGTGLSGFSKVKATLDKASGVTGWDWHDLRRTARTTMSRLGVSRDAAEAALAHVSGRAALVRTYDRHDFRDEALAALRAWQAHVARLAGAAPAATVVRLRPRGKAG